MGVSSCRRVNNEQTDRFVSFVADSVTKENLKQPKLAGTCFKCHHAKKTGTESGRLENKVSTNRDVIFRHEDVLENRVELKMSIKSDNLIPVISTNKRGAEGRHEHDDDEV
ncbi:hypothetical protein JTB14_031433 [Gonioctena quinquepunctata]|nr:hypothetical protein JTB14_031433 [Gonioctena quinquepunctata]